MAVDAPFATFSKVGNALCSTNFSICPASLRAFPPNFLAPQPSLFPNFDAPRNAYEKYGMMSLSYTGDKALMKEFSSLDFSFVE